MSRVKKAWAEVAKRDPPRGKSLGTPSLPLGRKFPMRPRPREGAKGQGRVPRTSGLGEPLPRGRDGGTEQLGGRGG